jgi:hypothetical protein
MRAFLAMALALGLCGCSDWNGSFFGSDDAHEVQAASAPVAEPAPAPEPTPAMSTSAPAQMTQTQPAEMAQPPASIQPGGTKGRCTTLARQRASDAAYAGEDEETQQSVYDRTYAGCMDWDARHAS